MKKIKFNKKYSSDYLFYIYISPVASYFFGTPGFNIHAPKLKNVPTLDFKSKFIIKLLLYFTYC